MSENDKEYNQFKNECHRLVMCPRCDKGVKAFIRKVITEDTFGQRYEEELHCAKCKIHGHKEGSYIETYIWAPKFEYSPEQKKWIVNGSHKLTVEEKHEVGLI